MSVGKINKKRVHRLDEMLRVDRYRENPTYSIGIGCPSLQRGVVLKWFYSLRAVGTPLSEVI